VSENQNGKSGDSNGKTGIIALATATAAAWLIYDMATTTEAPGTTLAILQYLLLAGMLLGLAGSLVKLISQK
jgi:hypothetical protein